MNSRILCDLVEHAAECGLYVAAVALVAVGVVLVLHARSAPPSPGGRP